MLQGLKTGRIFLKTVLLLLSFNIILTMIPVGTGNSFSIYNWLVPGRKRLPFGEEPAKSYNLSLFDIDAMIATHEVAGASKLPGEFRVFIIGDSSVWGTLLQPDETLAGQLNALDLKTTNGKTMRFFNLGYPTMSLTKDVLILMHAMQYEPDLIIWMVTLESFPLDKQCSVPLVFSNIPDIRRLTTLHDIDIDIPVYSTSIWDKSLLGRRRAWADWIRLQTYGIMWGITGIDQFYPDTYESAQVDFDEDVMFHSWLPSEMHMEHLSFDVLDVGAQIAQGVPILVINEPILISDGRNSDIRYNYFYPQWAYDQYREWMEEKSKTSNWMYIDLWDVIPADEFTNSAVHINALGEKTLASIIKYIIPYAKK